MRWCRQPYTAERNEVRKVEDGFRAAHQTHVPKHIMSLAHTAARLRQVPPVIAVGVTDPLRSTLRGADKEKW